MKEVIKHLSVVFADTYALYLKTQNYHWHVKGPQFRSLHELFEVQYKELAEAVDDLAERIRTLEEKTPATFSELNALKTITDGDSSLDAHTMVNELYEDNVALGKTLNELFQKASEVSDEGTVALLSDRIAVHEKAAWMLKSSL